MDGLINLIYSAASLLQSWQDVVNQGQRALSVLELSIPSLRHMPGQQADLLKLLSEAGCTSLAEGIASHDSFFRHNSPQLPQDMQDAYLSLQETVPNARSICNSLTGLVGDFKDTCASDQLKSSWQLDMLAPPEDPAEDSAAQELPSLTLEEAHLMILIATKQLLRHLELMERIADGITLAATEDELVAYGHIWQLQPFVDDDVVQSIQEYAALFEKQTSQAA